MLKIASHIKGNILKQRRKHIKSQIKQTLLKKKTNN